MGDWVALADNLSLWTGSCANIRLFLFFFLFLKKKVLKTSQRLELKLKQPKLVQTRWLPAFALYWPELLRAQKVNLCVMPWSWAQGSLLGAQGQLVASVWANRPSPSHHSSRMILGSGAFNIWRHALPSNEESGKEGRVKRLGSHSPFRADGCSCLLHCWLVFKETSIYFNSRLSWQYWFLKAVIAEDIAYTYCN